MNNQYYKLHYYRENKEMAKLQSMKTKLDRYQYLLIVCTLIFPLPAFTAENVPTTMKLKQCPSSPNCVSSQSNSNDHKIDPIPYKTTQLEAIKLIKQVVLSMPQTRLIKEEGQYVHIEFKTRFLKFIDDVEIVIDDSKKLIHIRSASRTGYSDLGTNRRRVETIREKFLR